MSELKRELGFWDLIYFNMSAIIGLRWLSVAAAVGYSSISLWALAFACFFLPQAYVVLQFTKKWPVEGGLYEWTKRTLGPFHGFFSGWCYWVNNIVYYPTLLAAAAGFATYIFAPKTLGLEESKSFIFWFSIITLWIIIVLNMIGMRIGKWVQNIGGITTWVPAGIIIVLGFTYYLLHGAATPFSAGQVLPMLDRDSISYWSTFCFAMAGFELVSLMCDEIKEPEKNIPRSVPIAGAMATGIYILGTLGLIVSVPHEKVSIISGVLQAIDVQASAFGLKYAVNVIAVAMVLSQFGGVGAWLAGSGRVLYSIGADRYIPKVFTSVHPRWGTPHISILTQGLFSTLFLMLSAWGSDEVKQFYRLLIDFNVIVYFIPYLYLFVAYFFFMRNKEAPMNAKGIASCLLGFASTLISIILCFIPPSGESDVVKYESKLVGITLLLVGPAFLLYARAHMLERRSNQ